MKNKKEKVMEFKVEGLLVSLNKQRVYSSSSQISPLKNILSRSSVENTETNDCCLRCGSLDQIVAFLDNAAARKSISSGSDNKVVAFSRNSSYSETLMNSVSSSTSFCLISNSCSESFDLIKHKFLYLLNSDFMNSGAENSALIEENKYEAVDQGFISENSILLSNTSIIFIYSEDFFFESVFSNCSLISGDTSESNLLNLPFLAFLPNSTDHLINSCSSLELNLFSNSCLLNNSCLTNSDKFTQTNFEISDFNSSSTANVIDAIYIIPLDFNSSSFLSSFIFLDITLRANSATFISGNSFLNLDNNSSGTDTVTLGILIPSIYFDTRKDVQLFKSFDLKSEINDRMKENKNENHRTSENEE